MPDSFVVNVSTFSVTPFGRYREDGDESGQVFREDILAPALRDHEFVTINVDGVAGLPSSFWEESLGGLVRDLGYSLDDLEHRLTIATSDPSLKVFVRLGWRYIREEDAKKT